MYDPVTIVSDNDSFTMWRDERGWHHINLKCLVYQEPEIFFQNDAEGRLTVCKHCCDRVAHINHEFEVVKIDESAENTEVDKQPNKEV